MTQDSREIRITAEPKDEQTCRFVVDQPVYKDGSAYFADRGRAAGSPIAEKIFEVPGVVSVLVQDNVVTVSADGTDDWKTLGRQVGPAIRAAFATGKPLVSEAAFKKLPSVGEIKRTIQELFDDQINPAIAAHGGWVELIDVKGNEVYVRLGGGCQGCGAADVTLKQGIEKSIRERLPDIGAIMDTTDHAAGRNPYYSPSK